MGKAWTVFFGMQIPTTENQARRLRRRGNLRTRSKGGQNKLEELGRYGGDGGGGGDTTEEEMEEEDASD
jgi:hypothetical protein